MAATIRSLLNSAPLTEVIGASRQDLQIGDTVNLFSVDPATTYLWTLAYTPTDKDGGASTAVFLPPENDNSSTANFVVDKAGSYLVRLIVDQGLPSEDTQFLRFRALTEFGQLTLVAAGERRDSSAIIPADADPNGWADDQNENILKINALLSKVSSSGRVLYVDANRGDDYSNAQNDPDIAKGYADYSSINAAIAAALANAVPPSSDNPFLILVRPGLYVEDVVLSPWVFVSSTTSIAPPGETLHPVNRAVRVQCENIGGTGTHSAVSVDPNEIIVARGLYFENTSNATTQSVMEVSGPGGVYFEQCSVIQNASGPGVGSALSVDGSWMQAAFCVFANYDTTNVLNPAVEVFGNNGTLGVYRTEIAGPTGVDVNQPVDSNVQFVLDNSTVQETGGDAAGWCIRAVPTALVIQDSRFTTTGGVTTELQINPNQEVYPFILVILERSRCLSVEFDTTNVTTAQMQIWDIDYDSLSVLPSEAALAGGEIVAAGSARSIGYDNSASGLTATDVQNAIDEIVAGGGGGSYDEYENGLVKAVLDAADSFTIPTDYQYIVSEEFTVDGSLTVDGELVILGTPGQFSAQTTNAVPTAATSVQIPANTSGIVKAYVSANRDTGAERAAFQVTAHVYNTGAGAVIGAAGVQNDFTDAGGTTWSVTITVSGDQAQIQVTGAVGATVNWNGQVDYSLSST